MADANISISKYKRNDLNAEYVRSILDYNPDTGVFTWKWRQGIPNNINGRFFGKWAGRKARNGYWDICINFRRYQAHRLAWLYMTGEWPKEEIDHRDTNRANNKWDNLREATHAQNGQNRIAKNTSISKGVSFLKCRGHHYIRARINISGKQIHLGYFDSIEDARKAYENAAHKYHREFAKF